jgi:hypothetical protein
MPVRPEVHHAATWYACSDLSGAIGGHLIECRLPEDNGVALCAAPQLPVSRITAQYQVTHPGVLAPCYRGEVEIKMPSRAAEMACRSSCPAVSWKHVFPELRFPGRNSQDYFAGSATCTGSLPF